MHRCTAAQREVVDMIATRVLAEVDDLHTGEASDPLCCLVCGGPGVGKSFVTTSARQLFESLGWVAGLQYQFGAFQAVVADQVQGDTLHHTFGINEFSNQDNMSMHERQSKARNLSQMRWLFIDEISQVNAELLAKCDTWCKMLRYINTKMGKAVAGVASMSYMLAIFANCRRLHSHPWQTFQMRC